LFRVVRIFNNKTIRFFAIVTKIESNQKETSLETKKEKRKILERDSTAQKTNRPKNRVLLRKISPVDVVRPCRAHLSSFYTPLKVFFCKIRKIIGKSCFEEYQILK